MRWLTQLLRAGTWADANRDRLRYLIARDSGVPEDFVEDSYSPRVFDQIDVTLDPSRIARLKARHDVLQRASVAGPIDFAAFIDPTPLAEAQASRLDG